MGSPELANLVKALHDLKVDLIVEGKEIFQYSRQDHTMALSFVLLASAALEDYIEQRCRRAASVAIERAKKAQPTRAGYALCIWYVFKKSSILSHQIPLSRDEISHDLLDKAEGKYTNMTRKSHGIDGSDLKNLLIPLGLADSQLNEQLIDLLDELRDRRNPAGHIKVNRARTMAAPIVEWQRIEAILKLLPALDDAIDNCVLNN